MSGTAVGLTVFGLMLVLMAVRVPIGIAMFAMGASAYVYLTGGELLQLLNTLKNLAYARLSNYDLVVIPMFLLMGQFATHGGLSAALFRFVRAFMGHWKGGIAMAAVGACAGFGAICGSSLATAATMGQVTLPELQARRLCRQPVDRRAGGRRHAGHHDPAVGAAGDLRHPDPGVDRQAVHGGRACPGIIAMVGYMLVIRLLVAWKPHIGPAGPRVPWARPAEGAASRCRRCC